MNGKNLNQLTIQKNSKAIASSGLLRFGVSRWIEAFLMDRKVRGLASGTIYFYKMMLQLFSDFLDQFDHSFTMGEISPNLIREYMIHLENTNHNAGGRHAAYRALRAFVYFWRDEIEPENWKNPFSKVAAPKTRKAPLPPVEIDQIQKLLDACDSSKGRTSQRDAAIILSLADTGCRASELLSINRDQIDLITGEVYIKDGKGSKPRFVYLGKKARLAVRRYLRTREDDHQAVWLSDQGGRLTYWGLRQVIRRRAEAAGIKTPSLHSFRRFFALACLRNGMDIYTLQRLMGHSDLQVLRRYLALSNDDLQSGHRLAGPVDHSIL
jgi:site-specific recombinase XerD